MALDTRPPIDPAIVAAVRGARHLAVLTGAGISAESGVPTFRDAQTGLWAKYDPRELATAEAFARNPKLVWDWYAWRRELVAGVHPNAGHIALVALEQRTPAFALVTQNVDGLHAAAGSSNVIELHGNVHRVRCSREGRVIEQWQGAGEDVPKCAHCGALLRPDVVWFGEALPEAALTAARRAAKHCDVLLVVGTSAEVYPAAALPSQAAAHGARVVEINPRETPLSSSAHHVVRATAATALPAIVAAAWA